MSTKTKEQISKNMKAVHNKDSEIELLLRKELWNRGLRYRKNYRGLIGKPDIVFIGECRSNCRKKRHAGRRGWCVDRTEI